MKKFIVILLVLLLCGCGKKDISGNPASTQNNPETEEEEVVAVNNPIVLDKDNVREIRYSYEYDLYKDYKIDDTHSCTGPLPNQYPVYWWVGIFDGQPKISWRECKPDDYIEDSVIISDPDYQEILDLINKVEIIPEHNEAEDRNENSKSKLLISTQQVPAYVAPMSKKLKQKIDSLITYDHGLWDVYADKDKWSNITIKPEDFYSLYWSESEEDDKYYVQYFSLSHPTEGSNLFIHTSDDIPSFSVDEEFVEKFTELINKSDCHYEEYIDENGNWFRDRDTKGKVFVTRAGQWTDDLICEYTEEMKQFIEAVVQ